MGTGMELEKKGLAEEAGYCCFWILGRGPVELHLTRALRTVLEGSQTEWARNRTGSVPGGREALSRGLPPTGCSIWREETCWPAAPAVPTSASSSSSGPCCLHHRSPPIQSSSGRQPQLRPQCMLLFSLHACFQQTTVLLTLKDKAKQSCADHQSSSFCICLFFKKNENFNFFNF